MEKLHYSSCNEDANSEIKALNINANDNVLCITGSGARVLDLLTQSPQRIYAIDCNQSQQNLLKLKASAIQQFDYENFSRFLGLIPAPYKERLQNYQQLKATLDADAQYFWNQRTHLIEKGVLFQGEWEKYFKRNAQLTFLIRQTKQKQLFKIDNLQEQATYWKKAWANSFWRLLLRLFSNRIVWRYAFKDPGFFLYVPKDFNIYHYINHCFERASTNFMFQKSHFTHLLFWGKWHSAYLPPHLQPENFDILKRNVNKISYYNNDLVSVLDTLAPASINKFSLSDFASYTSLSDYHKAWHYFPKIATKNAALCERQFLVKRPVSESDCIKRNYDLERVLEQEDQSMFYSFIIANIN